MESTDRRYKSMEPCTKCGCRPRPMSMSLCGSWECGSYIIYENDEYRIKHSEWCDAMSHIKCTLPLTPKDWVSIIDALEYHFNGIDGDKPQQNMEIVKQIKTSLNPYFKRMPV